jgi:hypothetical protein
MVFRHAALRNCISLTPALLVFSMQTRCSRFNGLFACKAQIKAAETAPSPDGFCAPLKAGVNASAGILANLTERLQFAETISQSCDVRSSRLSFDRLRNEHRKPWSAFDENASRPTGKKRRSFRQSTHRN